MPDAPRPIAGLAAGIAAGLVASALLLALQPRRARSAPHAPEPAPAGSDTATRLMLGAAVGGACGVLAEYRPDQSAGFGTAYGVATALLLDEAVEPARDDAPDAGAAPLAVHFRGLAGRLLFGAALEGVRGLIAGRRQ